MYRNNGIKKIREEKNITAKQIAEYLGITTQAVSQYEKGLRNPSLITLAKISDFLDVSIDELIGPQSTYMQRILDEILKSFDFTIETFANKINVPELELKALYNNEDTGATTLFTIFKVLEFIGIKTPVRIAEIITGDLTINILFNNKITPYCSDSIKFLEGAKKIIDDTEYENKLKKSLIEDQINRILESEKKKNILKIDVTDLSKEDIKNIEKYIEFIKFTKNK